MAKIAILGWGSLIWDPRQLKYKGNWQRGGPVLPIEFSRTSSRGRLTLESLYGKTEQETREYIQKAPEEVDTPVRRKLREIGWLNEERA